MDPIIDRAHAIIGGHAALPDDETQHALVDQLKNRSKYGLARGVLRKATEAEWRPVESVWATQQLALCTYKDEDLLPAERFGDALTLLESIGLTRPDRADPTRIPPDTIPETLGLGGAVHKYKWEQTGQVEDLRQAFAFYHGAWIRSRILDLGYGGVNAAFILDVLATKARATLARTGARTGEAERLAIDARVLREEMRDALPGLAIERKCQATYWYLVTLAEVHFGLGEYETAGSLLRDATNAQGHDPALEQGHGWQRQTTFRQLVKLAQVQGVPIAAAEGDASGLAPRARAALSALLGADAESAISCFRGRVGLALSGGGFRASLFHLGVLARLAEADVLRSVDVLSTVSGGSIVGAHYYLEVARLLSATPDHAIASADYVSIVQRVIDQFLAGVQRNIRTRVAAHPIANLMMVLLGRSRSHRVGELYEQHLYARVQDGHSPRTPRLMSNLLVAPSGCASPDDFTPKFSNWQRRAKVPNLLLNATSLNSGHGWIFTGRSMGEPPSLVGPDVEANPRYRRLRYEQAPRPDLQRYRLGWAVAASACVPGLFDPLVLKGLYPGRDVRLVDGGVRDNQGVGGLLTEACSIILCSDASGQMADVGRPSDGLLGVPLRTNSILQHRVRVLQYQDLLARAESGALQGFMFVHLKKGLDVQLLDWINCDDPTVAPAASSATTPYGVDKDIQRLLSSVRTDLDSFSEVEAYALMLSGYVMTEHELHVLDERHHTSGGTGTWGGFDVHAPRGAWPFLALENLMRQSPDSADARRTDLGAQLKASAAAAFKIWKLSPILRSVALGAAVALPGMLVWWLSLHWTRLVDVRMSASVGAIVWWTLLFTVAVLVPALKWLRPLEAMRSGIWKGVMALAGSLAANLHLWIFDPLYLRRGRLKRLMELK